MKIRPFLNALLLISATTLLSGCINLNFPVGFPTADFQEIVVKDGRGKKILMLEVDGVITSGPGRSDGFFSVSDSTVTSVLSRLEKARKDRAIGAIILRIDSPGGGVTASDVVYESIRKYKQETGVPVYATMLDMGTSGGYYIAMAADEVYAHPTTVTGSIGVIAMFLQAEELGRKIGLSAATLKSGANKDLGNPFHDMTAEQREVLQAMIDSMYARFLDVVRAGRPGLAPEKLTGHLVDGRVFTAPEAVEEGMIDGIMYLDELIEHVRASSPELSHGRVITYRKSSRTRMESAYAKSPIQEPPSSQVGVVNVSGLPGTQSGEPVFQYLWVP